MEELDYLVGELTFDFVFAAGVLSYLDETAATRVVLRCCDVHPKSWL